MTSKSPSEVIIPKVNLVDKVLNRPWKKVVAALVLTAIVIGSAGSIYIWLNPTFYSRENDNNTDLYNNNSIVLSDTDLKLLQFNPTQLILSKKTVKDLPIYPDSWRKANFTDFEIKNDSVSGPDVDPDYDGLTNKEEYIFGSSPKNPNTLGADGNDGEYVKNGRNPLTGLPLDNTDVSYYFLNSDVNALEEMNKNLTELEGNGIDVPKFFALSKQVDFTSEKDSVAVNIIENPTRDNSLRYLDEQAEISKNIVNSDYFNILNKIYRLDTLDKLNDLKSKNDGILYSFKNIAVPKQEVDTYKNIVYFFKKITDLIDLRIQVVNEKIKPTEYDQKQKDLLLRTVWAYRKITENTNKVDPNL